jgi:GH35 family endo-1,4-beta-xylanase/uncharacterized membrane protein
VLIIATGLFALAAILSAILFLKSSSHSLPGCGPKSACDIVTSSRWSRLGPIPIAAPGTLLYLLILAAAITHLTSPSLLPAFLLPLTATLALSCALWFTALQLLVIRKLCLYCTLTHAAASAASILILLNFPSPIPIAAGIACTLLFITLQVLIHPKQFQLTAAAEIPVVSTTSTLPLGSTEPVPSQPAPTPPTDTVSLVANRIQFSRADWPLLGSPTAPQTIGFLFDLTCTECRELYRTLLQATRQSPAFSVLAVPIPMHPACNPTVCKTTNPNPEACDFARLYLALWHADPAIFRQCETWLLGRSSLPSLMEARGHASRLLGASRLTLALTNPTLDTRLRLAVNIYTTLKPDKLPQLLLPHGIAQGKITMTDLEKLLRDPPTSHPPAPTIKEACKGYFLIGNAADLPMGFSDQDIALVKENYDIITPENCMKAHLVHPTENTWSFQRPDALVHWCKNNNIQVWGHTLVWHERTPDWFFAGNDKATIIQRLRDHITILVGRYKGKLKGWDVVNEVINEGGDAQTGKTENLRDSQWLRTIGPEFITLAFKFAHEADPDAELNYNDYDIEDGPKHASSMVLLKRLINEGTPITGVGIQGHWCASGLPYSAIDKAIADYASLGLKVSISELDITLNGTAGGQLDAPPAGGDLTAQELKDQAEAYGKLFAIFEKHKNSIDRVTFWGLNDRRSWRRGQNPLIFDGNNQRKPAYDTIVKALLHPDSF